jgi:hypothetical protein
VHSKLTFDEFCREIEKQIGLPMSAIERDFIGDVLGRRIESPRNCAGRNRSCIS